MVVALKITLALYLLGLVHSLLGFYQKRPILVRVAVWLVGAGFVCQTYFLVAVGIERRHFPLTNLAEALGFFAWSITLVFLAAFLRYRINVLGAFVLPLVSILSLLSEFVWEENHAIPPVLRSRWIYFHSTVAFLAYAAFFLTFISGLLYLIQERELKTKKFKFFYFRLPSLQLCDDLLKNSLFFGFAMMSVTIVTGALWAQQAWGRFWSWDPKETASLVTWGIYLLLINYRLSSAWTGRRAAYISIVGFISTLVTFGINWIRGLHTYI